MKVGDLVRMNPVAASRVAMPEAAEPGIVVSAQPACPDVSRETDLYVDVLYPDGREATWYDWQLEVISESR
jgi:hypothetical protein